MDLIYMNLSPKVQITKSGVTAEDVAEITGRNQDVVEKARKTQVYEFSEDHTRRIVSQLKVISCIEKACPSATVVPVGAQETILEYSSGAQ